MLEQSKNTIISEHAFSCTCLTKNIANFRDKFMVKISLECFRHGILTTGTKERIYNNWYRVGLRIVHVGFSMSNAVYELIKTCSQVPAAAREERRPAKSRESLARKTEATRMPFCMVLVTWVPMRKAPANSSTAAVSTACRSVSAPDPTDVPIAFATSFAPMFHAM